MSAAWAGAYRGRRVLVTGHTGFKGGWLSLWLAELGADVTGFALPAATDPSMFAAAGVAASVRHVEGDVRDLRALRETWRACRPDVVFHLAAQPIVRESYRQPVETITTNVVGTTHVLELARESEWPLALVCITSDKCYENVEWPYGYREDDRLGGADVYSGSKAAAEILISSYRRSFFGRADGPAVASVRAGNVIGGGDWAADRLVPDCIRALATGQTVQVRNPVGIIREWGSGRWEQPPADGGGHEATLLRLAIDRAQLLLGWGPRWDFDETMHRTVEWYREYYNGGDAAACTRRQIADYTSASIRQTAPVATTV